MNIESVIVNIIISLFAIAPVVYVIAGVYYWKLRAPHSVEYFSLFMFAVALYSFGYFCEINASSSFNAFFIRNFEFLGTAFVPTFFTLFIIQTTKLFKLKTKLVILFCSISTAIWLLYLTNPFLGLFYKSIVFSIDKYGGTMLTEKNIGFYLLMLYYVVQLVFSSTLLFKSVKIAKTKSSKNRFRFMFFTFQLSWLAVVFVLVGFDKYIDPAPLTIMIMCGLFSGNSFYHDMFERDLIRWHKNYSAIENPAFLVDTDGVIAGTNPAADKFTDSLNKQFEEIIPKLNEGEKNRKPVCFTINDKVKWVDVKKSVVNTQGTLTSYLLVDVSDEKHASLMAELFFNAIGDFVFIANKAGEIMFVNNEVKRRLDFDDEEIKRMHIVDFHQPVRRKEIYSAFEKALENKVNTCRYPLQTKSGDTIPVDTSVWLDTWNGDPVVFCMSKDISLFEETEEKFRKSFYKNPAIMAITKVDTGEYLDINDAFVRKLGYSKQELIGKTGTELNIFLDDNQRLKAKQQLLLNGEFSDIPVDIRAKDGSVFNGLFYGSYITLGNSMNLLTVMIDVTESFKRDNLLRIITSITQDFLKSISFMEPIKKAFALLGEAFDVSRILFHRCDLNADGSIHAIIPAAEWCSADTTPIIHDPSFHNLPDDIWNDHLLPVFDGKPYVSNVSVMHQVPLKEFYKRIGVKTILTIPVFENGTLFGILRLHESRNERVWTKVEENSMKVFADSLAMAIQSSKSVEKIEYLSFRDQLTGIYNRRFYEQAVHRLDNEKNYPLTLVMADVNGLKLTNDAFGHGAGDLLLIRFSSILSKECRAQDIVARIGGDEFVILLPKTDAKNASFIINRINKAISNEHIDNMVLSASIGFASKNTRSEDITDVFKKAEDEMYRNKLSESSSVRSKTIDLILNSLFEKNSSEMQHSQRVGNLCELIAKEMDFSKDDINQMNIAGLMHDIGKIGISEELIGKSEDLQPIEWNEIKRH